jgi:hypothetical protein
LAGLVARDASGVPRAGVFPRNLANIVTGRADMLVNIAAFEGVSVRGGGPLFMANDGTMTATVTAAPASNSRIDVVIFRQRENGYGGFADGNNLPSIEVIAGAASASPVKPSLAAIPGAVELATIRAAAGNTQTAQMTITQTHQFTHCSGGVMLGRGAAEIISWNPPDGSLAFQLDAGIMHIRESGAWVANETDWLGAPLGAGWVHYGGSWSTPQFLRSGRIVMVKGLVKNGISNTIMTFPAGFRPAQDRAVWLDSGGSGRALCTLFSATGALIISRYYGDGSSVLVNLNFDFVAEQ